MLRSFLVVALAACSHPAQTIESKAPVAPSPDDPTCPLIVPGTTVSVEDAPDGAALVFVTTGDAAAVRTRAGALAKLHNDGTKSDQERGQMGAMISSKSIATATDTQTGAKVTFVAPTAGDAGQLQDELRMHAHHLTGNTCKM